MPNMEATQLHQVRLLSSSKNWSGGIWCKTMLAQLIFLYCNLKTLIIVTSVLSREFCGFHHLNTDFFFLLFTALEYTTFLICAPWKCTKDSKTMTCSDYWLYWDLNTSCFLCLKLNRHGDKVLWCSETIMWSCFTVPLLESMCLESSLFYMISSRHHYCLCFYQISLFKSKFWWMISTFAIYFFNESTTLSGLRWTVCGFSLKM